MPTDARRPADAEAGRERLGRKAADGNQRERAHQQRTASRGDRSMWMHSRNEVRRSIGSQGEATAPPHAAASVSPFDSRVTAPARHLLVTAPASRGTPQARAFQEWVVRQAGGRPRDRKLAAVRGTPPAVGGTPGMDPGSQSEAKAPRVTQATARRMENATPKRIAAPRQKKPSTSGASTGAGRGSNHTYDGGTG